MKETNKLILSKKNMVISRAVSPVFACTRIPWFASGSLICSCAVRLFDQVISEERERRRVDERLWRVFLFKA